LGYFFFINFTIDFAFLIFLEWFLHRFLFLIDLNFK
jgi:hypothetical protein